MDEKLTASAIVGASLGMAAPVTETANAEGHFTFECHDADGNLLWSETIPNTVTTAGKNYALDTYLAGSGFTVVGPFMGLLSSVSYSAIAAADTMASHAGWTEAGITNAPTYSGGRKTCAWSAASAGSKALSAGLVFTFTGAGTVKGAFIALSTGAVSTVDSTAGTLYSAALFSGGDQIVANTNTLTVSYTASL